MIILFDVDGVLVHSRAYHLGLQKTVEYFGKRMGLTEPHTPTQVEIDLFEANSVTVEWESSAICVAALLQARLEQSRRDELRSREFWALLDALAAEPAGVPRPDFAALARRVGAATRPGQKPSLAALEMFMAPASAHPYLATLLGQCYDVHASPTHQVTQNFALGHRKYAESYGLTPHFEHPALLETEDAPLLSPELRDRLLAERAAGRVWFALYTARPSRPPRDIVTSPRGYTPEAEMALALLGLDGNVPTMAFGKLEWAARRVGRSAMEYVKPSPVQALAAIAAARTGREAEAIEAALAVQRGERLPELYASCANEHVHVFEDSASSLRAVAQAVELLNAYGLNLRLTRHGIAPEGSPKHAALAPIADQLHADINAGLQAVWAA
jgi:phosphoglycolate phosphatase-like HAD superfamily hydrolase